VRAQAFICVNLSPVEKEIVEPNETFVPLTRKERKTRVRKPAQAGFVCVAVVSTALIHLDLSCPKTQSSPY
jgi:hypothetical protein